MKLQLFRVGDNWAGMILRLTLGLVMFPHGAQKVLGWFGGPGFTKEMHHLTVDMQLPWVVSFLVIVIEFIGSISLILGFATRIWAIAFFFLFAGIILTAHLEYGFFMNWAGAQAGEGFEYHLLVLGICIALFFSHSDRFKFGKTSPVLKKS